MNEERGLNLNYIANNQRCGPLTQRRFHTGRDVDSLSGPQLSTVYLCPIPSMEEGPTKPVEGILRLVAWSLQRTILLKGGCIRRKGGLADDHKPRTETP